MQLFKYTENDDTITLEVDSLDSLDNIKAKIKDMTYGISKWHIIWESPQIFVRTATDNTICLAYKSSDTISDLKSKIRYTQGIPSTDQMLFFAGMVLDNSFPISRYNISQGSTLNLVRIREEFMSIFVMTTSGEQISLEVHTHFSVRRVKKMIMYQIGVGNLDGQRLVHVHAGEELCDTQTLFRVENGATLHLVDDTWMTSRNEMKIYVKIFPARRTIELNVTNLDIINSVKYLIQEKERIPIGLQVLYLPQKRLDVDTFTLAQYFILNGTTLYLVQTHDNQRPIDVTHSLGSLSSTHTQEEEEEEERKIDSYSNIISPLSNMQLCCSNVVLDVNGSETFHNLKERLKDMGYGLFRWHFNFESKIDPNSQSTKILVRFPSGKTIVLTFRSYNTVSDLKCRIYTAEGILPYDQTVFFAGMLLEDDFTLFHYKISAGFTLDVVLVFHGSLMVETTSGETIYLNAGANFTIRKVKDLIQDQTGIPIGQQQRLVNVDAGEELVDTRLLGSYLPRDKAILRLVEDTWMTSTNEMKVYVKIVATGDTIQLNVVSCDTINNVKNMIRDKEHIPICQQLLYLPQKRLEDDTFTLAQYYILNETTLHLAQIPGKEGILQDQQQLTVNREGNSLKRQKLCA